MASARVRLFVVRLNVASTEDGRHYGRSIRICLNGGQDELVLQFTWLSVVSDLQSTAYAGDPIIFLGTKRPLFARHGNRQAYGVDATIADLRRGS